MSDPPAAPNNSPVNISLAEGHKQIHESQRLQASEWSRSNSPESKVLSLESVRVGESARSIINAVRTPAPTIPAFDPATDISEDGMQFLDQVALAISTRVVEDVSYIGNELNRYMPRPQQDAMMSRQQYHYLVHERERNMDIVLDRKLNDQNPERLGVRKTIVVAIPAGIRTRMYDPRPAPPPPTEEELLVMRPTAPDLRIVLPGRLIQHDHIPAAFEPSAKFTDFLKSQVEEQVTAGLKARGEEAQKIFLRMISLIADELGVEEDDVCVFRVIEQDIVWVKDRSKRDIGYFDWKCTGCGRRHSMQVDELEDR